MTATGAAAAPTTCCAAAVVLNCGDVQRAHDHAGAIDTADDLRAPSDAVTAEITVAHDPHDAASKVFQEPNPNLAVDVAALAGAPATPFCCGSCGSCATENPRASREFDDVRRAAASFARLARRSGVRPRYSVREIKRALVDPWHVCAELEIDDCAKMQPSGLLICCLWHPERNPSCSVTIGPDGTLRVKCFGCGKATDVLGLIARRFGLDLRTHFREVLAIAVRFIDGAPLQHAFAQAPQVPLLSASVFDVVARAILDATPLDGVVAAYLSDRRLLGGARADGFGALPERRSQRRIWATAVAAAGADACIASGLFAADGSIKFPGHRLIIPWRATDGTIVTLQRREPEHGETSGPKYVFPAGRLPTQPFGIERLHLTDPSTEVAFVEGAIDALAYRVLCARHGLHRLVLGIPGTASWRPEWAVYAKDRVVHVALDADDAGDRAGARMTDDLLRAGALRVLRHRPSGAKDWAEIVERGTR